MKFFLSLLFCCSMSCSMSYAQFECVSVVGAATEATNAGGGGGSGAWQDVATFAETDTTTGINTSEILWAPIVAGTTGTATKARCYIATFGGASNLKMALHTSAGAIISGANGLTAASGAGDYLEITFGTPASVTASTTYKIAFQASNLNLDGRYLNGSGVLSYGSSAYASFPVANLPGDDGPLTKKFAVSLYIVP